MPKKRLYILGAIAAWVVACFVFSDDVGTAYVKAVAVPGIALFVIWHVQGSLRIGVSAVQTVFRSPGPK